MPTGTVKWFDPSDSRHFGFIITDDGRDVFVHQRDVMPAARHGGAQLPLIKGHRVAFDIEGAPKGQRARRVHVIGHVNELEQLIGELGEQARAKLLQLARRLRQR